MRGLHAHARRDPTRLAVAAADGSTTTFGELAAKVNQASHAFVAMGLGRESVVASCQPNGIDHFVVELGTTQMPWHFTPVNWKLSSVEIGHVLRDSGAAVFVVGHERLPDAVAAADEAGLAHDRILAAGVPAGAVLPPSVRSLAEVLERWPTTLPTGTEAGQRMLYTSGTTAFPKGVRRTLTGRSLDESLAALDYRAQVYGMDHEDGVHLGTGPLYHSAPGAYAVHSLHLGHTVVLTGRFEPETVLRTIEQHRATTAYMVPTMFSRLLALPASTRQRYDVSSLRSIVHTAAPCPRHVKHAMIDWVGPILYEVYGGTEGSATVVSSIEWLEHPGTVGKARQGADIRILGDDGEVCAPGEPGQIYIKNPAMQFRYFGDAAKTEAAFRGDYFTVGDIGYLDADGYLFLCDRAADVIISGGVNIYPAEVEAALLLHPAVMDVAVIGIPDDEWGEQVLAFVVASEGTDVEGDAGELLAADISDDCRRRIATFKAPRDVRFVEDLPRSDSGKILRRELRDEAWQSTGRRL